MRTRVLLLAMVLFPAVAAAQHDHAHDDGRESELGHPRHDEPAHPEHPHYTHPIVTESPLPETQLRLDLSHFRTDNDDDQSRTYSVEASIEYAVVPQFGLELAVPYTFVDPDDGETEDRLDNVGLGLKYANYAFAEHGLLLGAGLELSLPTGDAGRGIGSDRTIEVEPYVAVAYRRERFELISVLSFGVPVNEPSGEADDVDLELISSTSVLYHVTPRFAPLLELTASTVAVGDADETGVYLTPGVSVLPFASPRLRLNAGVSVPLTDDREFDYAVRTLLIYHF